jgi:hypothetical protein
MSNTFQMGLDKGSLNVEDLFTLMGRQLQLIQDEKKPIEKERKKHGEVQAKRRPATH